MSNLSFIQSPPYLVSLDPQTYRLLTPGYPFNYWVCEVAEIGPGVFEFGELYYCGFVSLGGFKISSEKSKYLIFRDLILQLQSLYESGLPSKESTLDQVTVSLSGSIKSLKTRYGFIQIKDEKLLISFREDLAENFNSILLRLEPDDIQAGMMDILSSLQWGFRHWKDRLSGRQSHAISEIMNTGLVPMPGYLNKSPQEYLEHIMKLHQSLPGWSAYPEDELKRLFWETIL